MTVLVPWCKTRLSYKNQPMNRNQLIALAIIFILTFSAAALGAIASTQAPEFYLSLARPGWAPPAWLFGPVWTVLYVMMAIAAWLVWQAVGWDKGRLALSFYGGQLFFNGLWTWLFFSWRLGALAFLEILLLWFLIACTIFLFWRIKAVAGVMLLPYLAWVSFAAALTWATWRLNPGLL